MRFIIVALILAAMSGGAVAQALVDASNPQKILQAAQKFGTAALSKDNTGDPLINGTMDDTNYGVLFYGCTKGASCKEITLVAVFEPNDTLSRQERIARCNGFNSKRRFGRAAVNDANEYVVDHAVTLTGGVSPANLDDTFDWWRVAMADFRKSVVDGGLATSVSLKNGDEEPRNASTKSYRAP